MRGPFVSVEDAHCVAEIEMAIRVRVANEVDAWIPKSQIHDNSEVYANEHKGHLVITQWISEQKGMDLIAEEYEP